MTWRNQLFWFLVLWVLVMTGYDCASKAAAGGPSDVLTVGRDLVRAIDRNTKAIERCR